MFALRSHERLGANILHRIVTVDRPGAAERNELSTDFLWNCVDLLCIHTFAGVRWRRWHGQLKLAAYLCT